METVTKFIKLDFSTHVYIGGLIRVILVAYSVFHDSHFLVPYTDVDYRVFTDAAKHVLNGESPYKRQGYRYSPIVAFLLIPNLFYSETFGKKLFGFFDMLIAVALKKLVERQLECKGNAAEIAKYCSLFWIYNPMSIAISSRGNADSIPCLFVILSIFFLQTDVVKGVSKYFLSGIFLGVAIHLRLYPLFLSFPMYLSLGKYRINRNTGLCEGVYSLFPNGKQIILTLTTMITLYLLMYGWYLIYGYEFLFESYLYHIIRRDTRHNFSIIFYNAYLRMDDMSFNPVHMILQLFEGIIMFIISLTFATKAETLPFALFCIPVMLVVYNAVMTSQYFIWFLSLLPLVVHSLKIGLGKAIFLLTLWLSAQGAWLYCAYLHEYKGRDVFLSIWLACVVFFCVNTYILGQLIKSYQPDYGFGLACQTTERKND